VHVRVDVGRFEDICCDFAFDLGIGVNALAVGIVVALTFGEKMVQFRDLGPRVDLGEAELTELESFVVDIMIFEQVDADFEEMDSIDDGEPVRFDLVVSGF